MAAAPLLEAGITFAVLALAGTLAAWVGQSAVPAYLLAGILVGPNAPTIGGISLSLVTASAFIDLLAELGIVFLLFFLGVEFSVERLLSNPRAITTIGLLDFVGNFGLGLALGLAFGFSVLASLFLAGVVYISSSAVITRSLVDLGWIANPESDPIIATLVVEDIVVAVYLAFLSAIVIGGATLSTVGPALATALGFLLVLGAMGYYGSTVVERLFDVRSDERFLLSVLGVTVLLAALALSFGVSEAVAAFFVGTAFSDTSLVDRIEVVLAPARDLFAAVFFFAIGLMTDLGQVWTTIDLLAVAVIFTATAKALTGYASGLVYGLDSRRSRRVGAGLIARGEFSLVVAALAISAGTTPLLSETIPAIATGYVLVTSVLGTTSMSYVDRVTTAE